MCQAERDAYPYLQIQVLAKLSAMHILSTKQVIDWNHVSSEVGHAKVISQPGNTALKGSVCVKRPAN